jgi:hypothetical protein
MRKATKEGKQTTGKDGGKKSKRSLTEKTKTPKSKLIQVTDDRKQGFLKICKSVLHCKIEYPDLLTEKGRAKWTESITAALGEGYGNLNQEEKKKVILSLFEKAGMSVAEQKATHCIFPFPQKLTRKTLGLDNPDATMSQKSKQGSHASNTESKKEEKEEGDGTASNTSNSNVNVVQTISGALQQMAFPPKPSPPKQTDSLNNLVAKFSTWSDRNIRKSAEYKSLPSASKKWFKTKLDEHREEALRRA